MAYFDKYGVEFSDDRKTLIKCPEDFAGTYIMPPNVHNIQSKAFYKCSKLKSIVIADTVKNIGREVFIACLNLEHISVYPINKVYDSRDNCNAIMETQSDTLVYGCKTTIIPLTTKRINDFAFALCYGMIDLKIPSGVTHIGKFAFAGCGRLISLELPDSIQSIESDAFMECTRLTSIVVPLGQEERFAAMDGLRNFADTIKNTSARRLANTQENEIYEQKKLLLMEAAKEYLTRHGNHVDNKQNQHTQGSTEKSKMQEREQIAKENRRIFIIIIIAILGLVMLINAKCAKTRSNHHYDLFDPSMEYRHT